MSALGVIWSKNSVDLVFDYDRRAINELKRNEGRWDPERRCWVVSPDVAEKMIRHLNRLGYRESVGRRVGQSGVKL